MIECRSYTTARPLINAVTMFFDLFGTYLEGGAIGSTKGCAHMYHYKIEYMIKIIQKLGHHVSNLYFIILWVKRTLSMDSLNLGEI